MSSPKATFEAGVPPAARRAEAQAMDHPFIDDHQVIERYVLGRLPEAEVADFELHFLGCPACLDQLEAAERLRGGLQGVAAEEVATRIGLLALAAKLSRSWTARTLVLLLALLPAALLWRSQRILERELAAARAPVGGIALLHLSPARVSGATPDVHLDLATAPRWVVLALDLGDASPGLFRAELAGPAGETLWIAEGLEADRGGVVALALPSSLFTLGDHRLALTPESGTPGIASFLLRTTRSP